MSEPMHIDLGNKPRLFELFNPLTEQVEGTHRMTPKRAEERNVQLNKLGAPQRWVPFLVVDVEEEEEEEP